MKMLMITLLFSLASSGSAADSDANPNAGRHVADDVEVVTLPGGEVVTRLVSRRGVTARQFWVDSVYGNQERILVFQGKGDVIQAATAAPAGQKEVRRMTRNDRAPNEKMDRVTQALDGR